MGDLLDRLNRELTRVNAEAVHGDRDARGFIRRRDGQGIDIYAHPNAMMALKLELELGTMFRLTEPKKGPPGAVGKYMDLWLIADDAQPDGALIIRVDGIVYSDVPVCPEKTNANAETKT